MKRIGFFGVVLVFSMVFAAAAKPAFVDYEHGWIFPQTLGGLPYELGEKYQNDDFGYSVFYRQGDNFAAEVSVHKLGDKPIVDGCKGNAIDIMLKRTEAILKVRQVKEEIAGLKKRGVAVVPPRGALQFTSIVFQYSDGDIDGVKKIQATYLTGLRDNIVKLEFTFDLVDGKKAQAMANQMIKQLIGVITTDAGEEELLLASCAACLHDPAGHGGRAAANYVIEKAATMDNISLYPHLFPWSDDESPHENINLLSAAYVAGMIQVVVPQKLEEGGGDYEGFVAMIGAYQTMRAKDQITPISPLDEWAAHPDKKALFAKLLE